MFNFFTELFQGEWETVGEYEGTCSVGPVVGSSNETACLFIIEKHSETNRVRGYVETPTGLTKNISSMYVKHVMETKLNKDCSEYNF